ncbi:chaperone SicP [Chromobacterium phragmitis]|uniref:chaperone SicP n=1 Tax=Chromobacterium amazonense TaxID=1382803 RepID=UPI0021B721CB|nr:chaperone SicP [Chromobacterium amazonense]MBM2885032.1 chaperone SicP [Chromobacterium amazonense]
MLALVGWTPVSLPAAPPAPSSSAASLRRAAGTAADVLIHQLCIRIFLCTLLTLHPFALHFQQYQAAYNAISMNANNMHNEYLGRLGERLAQPLSFDDNRQCLLMLDEQLLLALEANDQSWTLRGLLGKVNPDRGAAFWRELLMMNLELHAERAGTLAYESEAQALLYLDRIEEPGDTAAAFERLELFTNRQEKLRSMVLDTEQL